MKKAGIIALIMIFLYQAVGVFLLFKVRQNEVRQEIKSRIKAGVPKSELTVFRFDDHQMTQLRWVDDHEFILDGQMYDIVQTQYEGDKIIFHCLHDKQETVLFKNLNNMVAKELGGDQNTNSSKHHVTINWYYAETSSVPLFLDQISDKLNSRQEFNPDDRYILPESPPPNL